MEPNEFLFEVVHHVRKPELTGIDVAGVAAVGGEENTVDDVDLARSET
jgi:hypothetical protein